jgi:type II secretory pathway pseudopilin PulG
MIVLKRKHVVTRFAFSLTELVVVLGLLAVLLAILVPVLSRARGSGQSVQCASNLRQIGISFVSYAGDYDGYVPRDHTPPPWAEDRPSWVVLVGPYLEPTNVERWQEALQDNGLATLLAAEQDVLTCAAHPLAGRVPGGYVVNAFQVESSPDWQPAGPTKLARIRRPSDVLWFVEAADAFGEDSESRSPHNFVFHLEYRDAYSPSHLPDGVADRWTDDRHDATANVMKFDGSVNEVHRGSFSEMTMQARSLEGSILDDGVRDRADGLEIPPAGRTR